MNINAEITYPHQKIWFVQILRAVAALLVVIFHLLFQYWGDNNPENIALTFFKDVPIAATPDWIGDAYIWQRKVFSLGAFGVAIFFLISGFIIPVSLESVSIKTFIIRRLFRIYPMVIFAVLWAYGCYIGIETLRSHPIPYTFPDVIKSMTLLNDLLRNKLILGVLWTLKIEIKFYLIFTLLQFNSRSSILKIITFLMLVLLMRYTALDQIWWISYMFIGTVFYEYSKGAIPKVIAYCYPFLCIGACRKEDFIPLDALVPSIVAIGVFWLCFVMQQKIKYSRIINFFAEISYPLYLVHSIMGYTLFNLLYPVIPNIYMNVLVACIMSILVAYIAHIGIERPLLRIGKRISSV